ncbi:MAG: sulfurtransferase-like selenium metabolism protein YedF [Desulfovibrionaceae bacterium]|nr:sulfurtransferase-like selenium metabolism protein YedF [Desulfovibrionaceae bacterium]
MKKIIDCQGLSCPQPVITCRKILAVEKPEELEVLVDNLAASENVSRFLGSNGYSTEVDNSNPSIYRIIATCNSEMGLQPAEYFRKESEPNRTLVLITSETLGRGDDQLGAKLMENFLATLPELGSSLAFVVLLNGGVKLASIEGKALDSLKMLEHQGVKVLVCGTCLNHYGLLEQKQVGETTNMLDIISSLNLVDKVIRP